MVCKGLISRGAWERRRSYTDQSTLEGRLDPQRLKPRPEKTPLRAAIQHRRRFNSRICMVDPLAHKLRDNPLLHR